MHFASLDGGPCFIDVQGLFVSLCEPLLESIIFCYFCDLVLLKTAKISGSFLAKELAPCKGKYWSAKEKKAS